MPLFHLRRKKKSKVLDEKGIREIIGDELSSYMKRDELKGYLQRIEKDKKKKELWESLPAMKKIRLLRYALAKKEVQDAKK